MNYLYLAAFILMLLPGIYLATKKNFLVFSNKKFNNFVVRLILTGPVGFGLSFAISLFIQIWPIILRFDLPFDLPFEILFSVILSSILSILFFKIFILRKDIPPEFDPAFMNHELYVYVPRQKFFRRINLIVYPYGSLFNNTLLPDFQKNSTIGLKQLKNKDFVFTDLGEIIVSEKAISILSDNGFGDSFETSQIIRPVSKKGAVLKGDTSQPPENSYFWLIPKNTMPPLNPKSIIRETTIYNTFYKLQNYVVDDAFYYDRKVLETMSDFNVTSEVLGAYIPCPQKLWIVTKRTMELLLKEFDQHKRDFIPVKLIGDENKIQ